MICYRPQITVDLPIGSHVLHDYQKMWPSKILKLDDIQRHYVTNVLNEFRKNHIPPALSHVANEPTLTIGSFRKILIRILVFWECHHQNIYTCTNLLHTATSHSQRSNISQPKVQHLTAKGMTFQMFRPCWLNIVTSWQLNNRNWLISVFVLPTYRQYPYCRGLMQL